MDLLATRCTEITIPFHLFVLLIFLKLKYYYCLDSTKYYNNKSKIVLKYYND